MKLFVLKLFSLFNNLLSSRVARSNVQPWVISTRSINIESQDFTVKQLAITSTSLIECGAQFAIARETGDLMRGPNGYRFDEEARECQIGQVSFPIQEVENGGIRVHGISKCIPSFICIIAL